MAITKGALYSDWGCPEYVCAGGVYLCGGGPIEEISIRIGDWVRWAEQMDQKDSCSELFSKGLNTWGT